MVAFARSSQYRLRVQEALTDLRRVDAQIEDELQRSRQAISTLLRERDKVARIACEPRPESPAEVILEFATRRAPMSFRPVEVFHFVQERLGPSVTINRTTAWLSKLVRAKKLTKRRRGEYALV